MAYQKPGSPTRIPGPGFSVFLGSHYDPGFQFTGFSRVPGPDFSVFLGSC